MEKKNILAIIFVLVGVLIIIGILLYNGYIIPTKLEAEKYEIRGVDVSEYQGEIDWKTLSSQDIDFAFIKATEGSSYKDLYFTKNYEQLNKTNLLIFSPLIAQEKNKQKTIQKQLGQQKKTK